jgi:hypothetical protein
MSGKRCQLYRGERSELNGAKYTLGRDYGSIVSQYTLGPDCGMSQVRWKGKVKEMGNHFGTGIECWGLWRLVDLHDNYKRYQFLSSVSERVVQSPGCELTTDWSGVLLLAILSEVALRSHSGPICSVQFVGKQNQLQSSPHITPPSIRAYESLWTEMFFCTVFPFRAIPIHRHKLTAALYRGLTAETWTLSLHDTHKNLTLQV